MENIVHDYNNMHYDDSSDSSDSLSTDSSFDSSNSSSDSSNLSNFNTGINYYPIITQHQPFDPFDLYKPSIPVKLPKPIKPDSLKIPVHFDLKDTFNDYNESMTTLTNNINKTINIYGGYRDDNKAKMYNDYKDLYNIPKVNITLLKKFTPIILNSYLFPIEQEIADIVNNMNQTIKIYDNKYKEMLQYHNKYLEHSGETFKKLDNTKLE